MRTQKITKEQFIEAVKSGMTSKDICEKFNISSTTVSAYCTKYKVKIARGVGGRQSKIHYDNEYIVNELIKGTDHGIIAQHFGVARTTLNRYIRERDLLPADIRRKETSERIIQRELANAKFADPPKQPFKTVINGQKYVDVSCLYGI